jgi:hypothetical protein
MKKILMAAVAVSALTAGAASAASISSASLSGVSITSGAAYKIANETIFGTAGLNTSTAAADNYAVGTVTAGQLGVGTYTVTFALSGPAGFQSVLSNSSLSAVLPTTTNCVVAPTLVSGGGAGGTSVTYSVSLSGTCSTSPSAAPNDVGPSAFTLAQPLNVTGLGSVTETVAFAQGGVAIDNGTSAPFTVISNVAGFTTSATADTVATQWDLDGAAPYIALSTGAGYDAVVGSYGINAVTGVYVDAAGTTAASENLTAGISVAAALSNLKVTVQGTAGSASVGTLDLTTNGTNTAATATGLVSAATSRTLTVSTLVANTQSQSTKTFSLTVTPATSGSKFTPPAAYTTALQSISLEGTNYLAPWVGGSQSSAGTSIRLSNSGVATGAVTLQLGAPVYDAGTIAGATTCTSSTLSKLSSISANSELVISNADLTTCFGNFKRGDVTVTVQASPTSLTAKARNVNAATGVVSEISLGAS